MPVPLSGCAAPTPSRGERRLEQTVKEEVAKVPIIIDLMENEIIGPAIREGMEKGEQKGEQRLLRRMLEKRFGPLPDWAIARVATLSVTEIESLRERLFAAPAIDSLLS